MAGHSRMRSATLQRKKEKNKSTTLKKRLVHFFPTHTSMQGVPPHAMVALTGMMASPAARPAVTAASTAGHGSVGDMGPTMAKNVTLAGVVSLP
jgi:hypothetical protein